MSASPCHDRIGLLLVSAFALALILNSHPLWDPPIRGTDAHSYIRLAENPARMFDPAIYPHHAQRIFPSLLVWILSSVVPVRVGFCLLSQVFFLIWLLLIYRVLRALSIDWRVAVAGTCLIPLTSWVYPNLLDNVYQLCDLIPYSLTLLTAWAILRDRAWALLGLTVIGVLTRQNLAILAACGYGAMAIRTRDPRRLWPLAVPMLLFGATTLWAGGGAGGVLASTVKFRWDGILHYARLYEFPDLVGPFIWVVAQPLTLQAMRRYPWLAAFAWITILQPLGVAEMTGKTNVDRLAGGATWLFFLAALSWIDWCIRGSRWATRLFLLLSLFWALDVLRVLPSFPEPYATLVGREAKCLYLLLLCIVCLRRKVRTVKDLWHNGVIEAWPDFTPAPPPAETRGLRPA